MANTEHESVDRDQRLDQIVAAYLEAVAAGKAPDRQELLAQYPDLANQLAAFFADHDRMKQVVGAPGGAADATLPLEPGTPQAGTLPPQPAGAETATIPPDGALAAPPPGTKVRYFGDYELLEEIARGGMGVVYKARQVSLNRIVALKMILAGQLASEDDVKRFYTEAEAAANLDHPGIVPIYEVGHHEGQHYFSMGFVEGQSLAAKVTTGPLEPREAAALVKTVAEAVQFAHDKGVIHRDLKPANILLDCAAHPRVTDFGLAKRMAEERGLTVSGQVVGTPSYMPPEQAAGKIDQIGPASDIYSLGAILYCLLTGRPPFQSANTVDTLLQVIEQEPLPPRQLDPRIPRDLETICLKCLEKDAARRYPTAQHLSDDLRRFLRGEAITARPIGKAARLWRWCRRNPVVASLTAAVSVSLLLGVTVSTYFAIESSRRAEENLELAKSETVARIEADTRRKEAETQRQQADTERQRASAKAAEALAEKQEAEKQLLRSEGLLYANQIASALREWETNNVPSAWQYLDSSRADLRGWEYDYLYTLFNKNQMTLRGHTDHVLCVAFSPDGKRIASGSLDRTLKVWDVTSGRETLTLKGHSNSVLSVAFSLDGKRIGSGSFDKTLRVWDAISGRETLTLKGHTLPVSSVAFSSDGKRIASASFDKTLKVWDATSGQELLTLKGHVDRVFSVAFSPDGKRIASGSFDKTLKVWDAASGQEMFTMQEHAGHVWSVAFSPDGKLIASGSLDRTLKVWDATSGRETLMLKGHASDVVSVAFSPDGKRIVSGSSDNMLKVWDATNGRETLTLKGHAGPVSSVAFAPDGKRIASGSFDKTLKVWDATSGQEAPAIKGNTVRVSSVAFSPDGRRIGGAGRNPSVKVWDVATGQEALTLKGHTDWVHSVAFSPDGKRIASASHDETLRMWDAINGHESHALKGHTGSVHSVAFSPDGKRIASASQDTTLKVWDVSTGQEALTLKGHKDWVDSVAFSPDGRRIASASHDDTVRVWDATNGQESLTLRGHTGFVHSVAFSPDGRRIASASRDKTVKVWEAISGRETLTLKGHTGPVQGVAFSPDGKRIASASDDSTLKIWNATSGQETLTLKGHTARVLSLAFSPDGKRIASGSYDGSVIVWEAATRQESSPFRGLDRVPFALRVEPKIPEFSQPKRREKGTAISKQAPPALLEPKPGAVLENGSRDGTKAYSWEFRWSPLPGAGQYHLEVWGEGARVRSIDKPELKDPHFRDLKRGYVGGLNLNGWRWKVRALMSDGWTEWSETRPFDVAPPMN